MPFDALFCIGLADELKTTLNGAKIEKIHRPEATEIDFQVYTTARERVCLIVSASMSNPRISIFKGERERPNVPDSFSMLLRKHLLSARITDIRAVENERIIIFDFDSFDDLGYCKKKTLYAEIMGKHSNIILCDGENKVLGALYQSDITTVARHIMVGLPYEAPPAQNKLSPFNIGEQEFTELHKASQGKRNDKFILDTFLNFSPLTAREVASRAGNDNADSVSLYRAFDSFIQTVKNKEFSPCIVIVDDKYTEFSFIEIKQYGITADTKILSSFSEVLNEYYEDKSRTERIAARSRELTRILKNTLNRLIKKAEAQQNDLAECSAKNEYKRQGDAIIASIYLLKQGMEKAVLTDYETGGTITVKLDKSLTPSKNAERLFKKYAKLKRAEAMLIPLIESTKREIEYIESVIDCVSRLSTSDEFEDVKKELAESGYLPKKKKGSNDKALSKPFVYITEGGFTVKAGKNNIQNDKLTFSADKNDIWFHTKALPGSHTILYTDGKTPSNEDMTEAASIAATHSKASGNDNVAVDYTLVRYVKKPSGSKPGYVIYDKYKTAYVNGRYKWQKR